MRVTSIIGAIAGTLLLTLIAGCSSSDPGAKPSAVPTTTTPSATATPQASTEKVLFTIAAKVRDKTGNTIAIELVAHTPLPYSDRSAKPIISDFVGACGAGVGATPVTAETLAANGSILMPLELVSSVTGKPFAHPITLTLGNVYFGQSATGTGIAPVNSAHPCSSGYTWSTSGTGRVIADFESGNPGPDLSLWKFALYGFSVPPDSQSTIEACSVTLSNEAKTTVADMAGWDPSQSATGYACTIGYVGE